MKPAKRIDGTINWEDGKWGGDGGGGKRGSNPALRRVGTVVGAVVARVAEVPIVPYGGATSIEGHTLAPHGGVCIDMSSMKKIKSLHVEDMDVVVEPGVGWIELNEYLKPHGPGATIGGMCATRCSGSLAVRYGTMRDNVINLQAVLPDGDVVKTGSRARKSAAGYTRTAPVS
uniref:D-lactate dehydrogenase (Cytochrome), mitochondrial n=1 Tax=Aegilops tauschii TaxID=37682 RepID=M8CVX9_AEGTA